MYIARRFWAMAAAVAITAIAAAGCDVDADLNSQVAIGITVEPGEWNVMLDGGQFDYYYVDRDIREITPNVFTSGSFHTYWKYGEMRDGAVVDVQEPLPAVMNLSRYSEGRWTPYTETISCSYEVNWMRIMISRSDFFSGRPGNTMYFRTVVAGRR